MSLPKAVKITKNGVEFVSNVERLQYTLKELERAALRDVGKLVCKRTKQKIKRRTGRLAKNTQYWVRSKQKIPDLQVGFKPGGFYGLYQEIGTSKAPKIGALSNAAEDNISDIIKIESQYLSGIGTEEAESLIKEGDYQGE
ncbi:HK97-gp10 family putative phage morphogenesis protein [Ruminococcus sp.]|jgi:HK97 gp10 family phage protein|uniref:HK97-gp10 family putative phage morphogenesis protein n=1 Tax=Ruminococcus sp. TaxID=41978 RepID=UPI00204CB55A|nr:MAG TPA: type I neck protein [Caudoviricetes sp.]